MMAAAPVQERARMDAVAIEEDTQVDRQSAPDDDVNVVKFVQPGTKTEEISQKAEADRLANLPDIEWRFQLDKSAKRIGMPKSDLQAAVIAIRRDREKKERKAEAENRRRDQRLEKQRTTTERDQNREREREQARIDKEAERKGKEKSKAFAVILKLPNGQHEAKLADLAKRLGEDLAALRVEFDDYAETEGDTGATPSDWDVEPWAEPVATAELLQDLITKIS